MWLAASAFRCLPTGIEPVKEILRIDRVRNEILGDLGRHAVDQVDHARGQAGVVETLDEPDRRARRLLWALDDDGAPRRQCRSDLAHRLGDREVPGREARHHADRLLDHHVAHAVGTPGDDAAVGALALAGIPVDDVGGARNLDLGLHQHLALLHGEDLGDLVGAGAHEVGRLAQDLAALVGRNLAPLLEALVGRGQRLVEVAPRDVPEHADGLAGGRVHNVLRLGAGGLHPAAVDVVLEGGVHSFVPFGFSMGELTE